MHMHKLDTLYLVMGSTVNLVSLGVTDVKILIFKTKLS